MKKILARIAKFTFLAAFVVGATITINNAWAATLTESPGNIAQGGTVTATWSAIAAPTTREWIGLYTPGAADTAFIDYIYVNTCSKSGGSTAPANGQCSFLIPSSLPNGTYELRLLANNGYTRLATSNQFNVAPVPPSPFVDNGDGTISDIRTGLMWEKKTGTLSFPLNICANPSDCSDARNVNNTYTWSATGTARDGSVFTNFLEKLNGELCSLDTCNGLGGYTDWRLPTIAELESTMTRSCAAGAGNFCNDPIFTPTQPSEKSAYWSSTTYTDIPTTAFVVGFTNGVGIGTKSGFGDVVRAVRGGR